MMYPIRMSKTMSTFTSLAILLGGAVTTQSKYVAVFSGLGYNGEKADDYYKAAESVGAAIGNSQYGISYCASKAPVFKKMIDAAKEFATVERVSGKKRLYVKGVAHSAYPDDVAVLFEKNKYSLAVSFKTKTNDFEHNEEILRGSGLAVVLPGGPETMRELWYAAFLNYQKALKPEEADDSRVPIVVVNVDGFFDGVKTQLGGLFENDEYRSFVQGSCIHVVDESVAVSYIEGRNPIKCSNVVGNGAGDVAVNNESGAAMAERLDTMVSGCSGHIELNGLFTPVTLVDFWYIASQVKHIQKKKMSKASFLEKNPLALKLGLVDKPGLYSGTSEQLKKYQNSGLNPKFSNCIDSQLVQVAVPAKRDDDAAALPAKSKVDERDVSNSTGSIRDSEDSTSPTPCLSNTFDDEEMEQQQHTGRQDANQPSSKLT